MITLSKPEGRFVKSLFLIAAVALAAGGCGSEGETPGPASRAETPDQEVVEFSLTETVQGSKSWTLFADRAEMFNKKGYSKVHGVKVHFFDPDGEVSSVLTSLRGRVEDSRKDVQAFGQVVLETKDGVKLETETLHWDNRRGVIWSNDFVTVTRGSEVLTGYGFESDPNLTDVEVKSQVKIKVDGEEAGASVDDSPKAQG
jgi:LPS export ABC transporter protein LptC